LWTVRVHHHPYPLFAIRTLELEDQLVQAAGIRNPGQPTALQFSAGVDVEIFPPCVRLTARA
jgi:uncharacterized protein YqjF (DUF2071 family)